MKASTPPTSRSRVRRVLTLAAGIAAAAAALTPGSAHAADATLVSSTPAANTGVQTSPASLSMVFNAPVGTAQVEMTCGDPVQVMTLGAPTVLADQLTVSVTVTSVAPKGNCNVGWKVTDLNLQPAGTGTFSFTITADPATTTSTVAGSTVPGQTTTTTPATVVIVDPGTPADDGTGSSGPVALFRLLSNLGLAVVFGSLLLIALAWPEGPEYLLTIRFMRMSWAFAVVSAGLYAGALEAQQTGSALMSSLAPTAWADLLETGSGKAAVLRVALIVGAGYAALNPVRAIDPNARLQALLPPTLAVATVAFSREEFGIIEYVAGIGHALSMAAWLGGLVLLSRVVLAGPGEHDLVEAVRGFSRIATPALWGTVITGAVLLFRLDRGALLTSHGLVLVLKTLVVAAMVFVSVAIRQYVQQHLARAREMTTPMASRLRRAIGVEAGLGVLVLLMTSWLLTLTPPALGAAGGPDLDLGPVHQFANPALNSDVKVQFSEAVGVNDVRIEVVTPATGLSGLAVDFLPPDTSSVNGMTIDPVPLSGAGVAVLQKVDGFTLGASGTWTVVVRVGEAEVGRLNVYVASELDTITASSTTVAG